MKGMLYNLGYRWFTMPWEIGPRAELVGLVDAGRLTPGRTLDIGCGTGANSVHLARHGFDVTGVDFAPAALDRAVLAANAAGVAVRWVRDDITALRTDLGLFDVLVDYGTLDDLSAADRDRYVANIVPLAAPGARFLLWGFEWPTRRFDRITRFEPLAPGEVEARFGDRFDIERFSATEAPTMRRFIPGHAVYLMTRRAETV